MEDQTKAIECLIEGFRWNGDPDTKNVAVDFNGAHGDAVLQMVEVGGKKSDFTF